MELRIIFSMLSILSFGIIHPAAPATLADVSLSSNTRHSRSKRCSCATFLDKECVYFCHLDIIWVNTPERTVSYGLGNAPRKKRSVQEGNRSTQLPRCQCAHSNDYTCVSFCDAHNVQRHKAARDKVILTASGNDCAEKECKYDLAAKMRGIKRTIKKLQPSIARSTRQLDLLLRKWRKRWPHMVPTSTAETTNS